MPVALAPKPWTVVESALPHATQTPAERRESLTAELALILLRVTPVRVHSSIGAVVFGWLLGCAADGEVPVGDGSGSTSGGSTVGTGSGQNPSSTGTPSDTASNATTQDSSSSGDESTGPLTEGSSGEPVECSAAEPPAVGGVVTTHGTVRGVVDEGVTSFLGIPYAEPPVGERRWQPPEPPACWEDVYAAVRPGPVCAQLESIDGPVIGDEDCLFVNVWTPDASTDEARPVMVFIHGGGHAIGSGSDPLYNGARLARTYGVVVVTINYRLGALGYLAHDVLDQRDERTVSGNYGLLDQLLSLRWVSENIEAFGGDPQRVTLFGESAGAVGTCAVLGAPAAEGLVHGAILQSGGCSQRSSERYREQVGDPWVAASTCAGEDDVAACLEAMPFADVIAAEPTGFPSVAALGQAWSAYVDGVTLPRSTIEQMADGEHIDVPLVVGANAEETARDTPLLDQPGYESLVAATFGGFGDAVLAQYPSADYPSPSNAWTAITSDVKFVCQARRTLEAAVGGRSPAFRYHFSYDGYTTGPMGDPSAFHGLELVYIFANFDALFSLGFPYPVNADDEAMVGLLGSAWTQFATNGAPSSADLAWPPYEEGVDPYAGLDVPWAAGQGVRSAQCDFWDTLLDLGE